ncbi:uncharacterized protein LOC119989476 [Tripterygium wilfordii]|uniref:uncharacterized protein LOC119989476 n=1 Tax=Tripterygium wilfordii TaxID=458696 RepID=UPI0018F83D0F|nr:uncharacterized protein LOC119989476 [Tripterygium wilfordii]
MAKNRNKKNHKGVASMDITEPTVSDFPQDMDTSEPGARSSFSTSRLVTTDEYKDILFTDPWIRHTWLLKESKDGYLQRSASNSFCVSILVEFKQRGRKNIESCKISRVFKVSCLAFIMTTSFYSFLTVDIFGNRKIKGRPMKRSKNVRKKKALAKAIASNEKSVEKVLKNDSKTIRTQSAKALYD